MLIRYLSRGETVSYRLIIGFGQLFMVLAILGFFLPANLTGLSDFTRGFMAVFSGMMTGVSVVFNLYGLMLYRRSR